MNLPAGQYFIGDPCYVFSHHEWDTVCDQLLDHVGDVFTLDVGDKSAPMFTAHTAYGDGTYLGSDGFEYAVDAGLIGAVPLSLIDRENLDPRLGRVYNAPHGIEASESEGTFTFDIIGVTHLTIETGDSEEDTDDWDDEDEDRDELDK